QENVRHTFQENLCVKCGAGIRKKFRLCSRCRYEISKKKTRDKRMRVINEEKLILRSLDFSTLKQREREFIKLRLKGKSYTEIGKAYGLSRQRISQIMKDILKKT